MKKLLFSLLILPATLCAQNTIRRNNPLEVVAYVGQTRLIKLVDQANDTFYIVSYINKIRDHQIKMFSIGTKEEVGDFMKLIMSMYQKPNQADSYTVNTATGLLSIFWSQNQVVVSQDKYSALVISYDAAKKLNQF